MSRLRWLAPLLVAAVFTPALATLWIGLHEGVAHADRFHHHAAAHAHGPDGGHHLGQGAAHVVADHGDADHGDAASGHAASGDADQGHAGRGRAALGRSAHVHTHGDAAQVHSHGGAALVHGQGEGRGQSPRAHGSDGAEGGPHRGDGTAPDEGRVADRPASDPRGGAAPAGDLRPTPLLASAPDAGHHHRHLAPEPTLDPAHRRAFRSAPAAGGESPVAATGVAAMPARPWDAVSPAIRRADDPGGPPLPSPPLFTAHCALLL